MTTSAAARSSKTTSRLRLALSSDSELDAVRALPVLEITAEPTELGRWSSQWVEGEDTWLGQCKRLGWELSMAEPEGETARFITFFKFFRATDDGTLTLYVDIDACVRHARSPLSIAQAAVRHLGLSDAPVSWVHTEAEKEFWQKVDPHLVAQTLSR